MIENKYLNRAGDAITFKELDDSHIEVTGYSSSFVRIGEAGINSLQKKNNPGRTVVIDFIDFPDGPFIFCGGDANDYLKNKSNTSLSKDYLESDHRKIITNIDYQPTNSRVILKYEKKSPKGKTIPTEKNSSKEEEFEFKDPTDK